MTCPPWHKAVLEAEACLQRDDSGYGLFARQDAERLVSRLDSDTAPADSAPDKDAFAFMVAALRVWARRSDPVQRDRLSGIVLAACNALTGVHREGRAEAERRALAGAARGLPRSDQ